MPADTEVSKLAVEADSAIKRGDLGAARALLSRLVADNPTHAYGFLRLGLAERAAGEPQKAQAALLRAAEIGHPLAMYELAQISTDTGDLDKALEWLRRAVHAGFHDYDRLTADTSLSTLRARTDWPTIERELDGVMRPAMYQAQRRQLDFWLGRWEVRTVDGRLVGRNKITLGWGGAFVVEDWTALAGWRGRSLNFYNANDDFWEQIWVDDSGDHTHYLDGQLDGHAMRFTRDTRGLKRLTIEERREGGIRQIGETRGDPQSDWQTEYELYYEPLV